MAMSLLWVVSTLARWSRWCRTCAVPARLAGACVSAAVLAICVYGGALDSIGTAYRKTPNARTHAALLAFASAHRQDQEGGLALLALGAGEVDQKQDAAAVQHLTEAAKRVPQLADYAACWRAEAEWELKQVSQAEADTKLVWERTPASPLRARATLIAVRAWLQRLRRRATGRRRGAATAASSSRNRA